MKERSMWIEETYPDFGTMRDFERSMQKAATRWARSREKHYGLPPPSQVDRDEYRKAYAVSAPRSLTETTPGVGVDCITLNHLTFRKEEANVFGMFMKLWAKLK